MSKNKTLNLISLGCAKNLVDSEILLGGLNKTDVTLTQNPEEADTIVVNTCGFLDIAREESVDTILQAAELKKAGNLKELVVMGCLSERYPDELKKEIPEVDRIFGSNDHRQIVSFLTGKEFAKDDPLFFRSLMTPNHYAYLKIAEGCDNGCSFCSIPLMRGLQKSRTIPAIMDEAERLVKNGTKELLVIAQDSTSYGWDLETKVYLSDLLRELNTIKNLEWIRIHYAHPAHLSQRIIDAMAECDKVCNYLDMPIQHASDTILKSMKRGLGQDGIRNRIHRLRSAIPEIAIRTTLIVGYPGETEDDFNSLRDFVEEMKFDRLGVFTYSEEEGTGAAHLDDNIPRQVKDDRKNLLIEIQNEISLDRNESFVGKTLKVLVDQEGENVSVGRTEYDSPEIDNIVHIQGKVDKGNFVRVRIESANEYELIGSIV
ncbi:MAG: 30S ribosomal protein S12 methylthiotransferase RimO [Candidatus Marinimicrobia bacterium]|jgi:ribosomal protein S12 methylthiotransferase|nr:30S ribosomal protein S12 methylthiotransferase RimO [Candidatus Neomarinimicrobiota bacterium]MBT3849323.1 30S ribosomal protein S12 methylthiotransferase RimO [Candidatus Neomarinimicrobiota bacterium]MBT4053897.1 30S ribosomal protein S12 methylthiotransferase RimO [Candidatus Neomarinimicrobiota bacterium]MBT4370551.1 30S ribosomal protein S12 methylthiotransferase RimO [Candidatus Neomarinimicrobiota bacterium]MBT4661199.1 30S ribosomal protein S12 methylthiotransferase RimO [Candidatus